MTERANISPPEMQWLDARLRELLMRGPSAIGITAGPEHRWVFVNEARAKMAGRAGIDDFIGKPVRETYPELRGLQFFDLLDQVYQTGVPYVGTELRAIFNRGPNGAPEEAYVNALYQPIRSHDGKVEGLLIHTVEVTSQVAARTKLESSVRERTLELERAREALGFLSARLIQTQDEERRRVARELHDSVGQYLAAIQMNLSFISQLPALPEILKSPLQDSVDLVERCTAEIRTISYLLHPPLLDEMGLVSAISWFIEGFSQRSGILVTSDIPADLPRFSPEVETAVFRIVQQSLANVHRHSSSKTAHIRLHTTNHRLTVEISDAGQGLPPEVLTRFHESGQLPGVGISGMRERIINMRGEFNILSGDRGTTIAAVIPI